MVPNLVGTKGGVEQENAAGHGVAEHVVLVHKHELVAGHKVGPADEVGRADRLGPKTQVGNGHRASFFGVVHEVALTVVVGFFGNDLDGILVGSHCPVGTQAEEHRPLHLVRLDVEVPIEGQGSVGHIVHDAHGKVVLGIGFGQLVVHRFDHGRRELLGGKPVAATHHPRHGGKPPTVGAVLHESRNHIEVKRLAQGTGLLGAVQNRNGLGCCWQGRDEVFDREGAVQADLEHADLFAPGQSPLHVLVGDLSP
ncbi:hypothetical protein HRbin09_00578 [bacterium HR09]|nr:hypothetical protein HRbin09_00578 [bacterium HR09]